MFVLINTLNRYRQLIITKTGRRVYEFIFNQTVEKKKLQQAFFTAILPKTIDIFMPFRFTKFLANKIEKCQCVNFLWRLKLILVSSINGNYIL